MGKVNLEFDQPRFALLLAGVLGGFTAGHVAAAAHSAASMYKAAVVQALVPLSGDLDADDGALIRRELSEWDQVVCEKSLPVVLQGP